MTRLSVLLAALEATPGVDAVPTINDALLVGEPTFEADATALTRDFMTPYLGTQADIIGRKIAKITFKHELRGNGVQNSGLLANAPRLGRLLQACGFAATPFTVGYAGAAVPDNGASQVALATAFASAGAVVSGFKFPVVYTVAVTTGGASGAAQASVTPSDVTNGGAAATGVALTSGTAFPLGTSGATIAPTFTGNLVVGDTWRVVVLPAGITYTPVSDGYVTLTLSLYFNGIFHKVTNAMGTFKVTCDGGKLPSIDFTFSGQYVPAASVAMPSAPVYERTLPSQVERAALSWGALASPSASGWSFDIGNTVTARPDINDDDAYNGFLITARKATGSFDPEATPEAINPWWADFAAGSLKYFAVRQGKQPGNIVQVIAPTVQTSKLAYKDRDGIRALTSDLAFTPHTGNDEILFHFC
jgi:hypothetical protein